ncbi:MAG: hypothetical protein LBK47_09180 [Prevotellaceae bacterium]|jgi:hypothetical protein|nr:hypothetical protein [Prevotellaceae bacterium]
MNTPSHNSNDKLKELFDLLPPPTTSRNFEQEAMRRIYLAAQKKQQVEERKWAIKAALGTAAIAACITVAVIGGLLWLSEQQQSIELFLQKVHITQMLKSFDKEYLWLLTVGALIWFMSCSTSSHQRSHQ